MRLPAIILLLVAFAPFALADNPNPNVGTIAGTVVGMDGKPLADFPVKIFYAKNAGKKIALADPPPRAPGMDAVAETKTGKDGTFKFENLTPSDYMIIAGDMVKGLGRSPATVKEGKTVEVKITVRKRRVA
jgi:protocatechuate 3,4-dioxygenase beta subunit